MRDPGSHVRGRSWTHANTTTSWGAPSIRCYSFSCIHHRSQPLSASGSRWVPERYRSYSHARASTPPFFWLPEPNLAY